MSRADELACARAIEAAEVALLSAVADSPLACAALADIARELREGQRPLLDVVRTTGDLPMAEAERAVAELFDDLAKSSARTSGTAKGSGRLRQARRADCVAKLAPFRLAQRSTDRVLTRLDESSGEASGPARAAAAAVREASAKARRARARLVEANLRLVVWMARRQADKGLQLHDLVQEGNIGLMRAAEKFDARRGTRFCTYASFWIRQSINRALSDQSRLIRLPVHLVETKHKLQLPAQRFVHERSREPTDDELAELSGMPVEKIRDVSRAPKQPVSMDAPTYGSEGDVSLGDRIADLSVPSPIERISQKHLEARILELFSTLSPRERRVLELRFGLEGDEVLTLEEIGRSMSVSRERVRQIEAAALAKLRAQATAEQLGELVG